MTDATPKTALSRPKRTFTVTVGLSTVISSILVICAGFVALFALGVLLGRGYDPEAGIPKLERMMPQPGRPSAPIVISDGESAPESLPQEKKTASGGVLGQGDLAYPDSLKTPPRHATPKPQGAPRQKTEQPAKQEQNAKQPRQPEKGTSPATDTAPVRTAAQNQSQQQAGDTQTFQYVYQVAAYKDQPSCDRFIEKLKKAGLKARVQKSADNGVTWYRVLVDFTGRPDDTDSLRATLQNLGAGKPLMKAKVPAN